MSSKRPRPQNHLIPAEVYQQTALVQEDGPELAVTETAPHMERCWELRNHAEGSPEHDWFDAEHELQHRQQERQD